MVLLWPWAGARVVDFSFNLWWFFSNFSPQEIQFTVFLSPMLKVLDKIWRLWGQAAWPWVALLWNGRRLFIFSQITPSKHFLWPTHIRRKPNHCKTHYLYCSCPQILVTYMFICASKIWGPGPKPVLFRSQKPVFEAPECWTGSPLVQPTRDSMWASLSLSSKFSNKNSDKKNNFAWNFWGPCDRKYWLGICPKEWDGLTQWN